ncbi:MAG: extracellular solute-binding protein, partial [Acidimicrobiia bacterium]|nr:extracellular solute-binding protein [Acidimicrobiia bacterium]
GTYAAQALDRAGVELDEGSVTREPDAATTVGAVANGDADAGIVYLSDAVAAKTALARVPIPKVDNVIATYPIAVVAGTPHRKLATAFVEAVQSPRGQAVLRRFGFLPAR